MEVDESSSDSSSKRSLAISRGRCSALMKADEPSLSRHDVGVDSTGMRPEISKVVPSRSLLIFGCCNGFLKVSFFETFRHCGFDRMAR